MSIQFDWLIMYEQLKPYEWLTMATKTRVDKKTL